MTGTDIVWSLVALALTGAVLSYLVHDNPIYRVALHLLIGLSAGYAAFVTVWTLGYGQIYQNLMYTPGGASNGFSEFLLAIAPVIGVMILLTTVQVKFFHRTAMVILGFLLGVGAVVTIGGVILGTLIPLVRSGIMSASGQPSVVTGESGFSQTNIAILLVLGSALSLGSFFYGLPKFAATRSALLTRWYSIPMQIGRAFIVVTLGALYAGALLTGVAMLTDRLFFILDALSALLQG